MFTYFSNRCVKVCFSFCMLKYIKIVILFIVNFLNIPVMPPEILRSSVTLFSYIFVQTFSITIAIMYTIQYLVILRCCFNRIGAMDIIGK